MRVFSHLRIAAVRLSPLLLVASFALACAVDTTEPRPGHLHAGFAAVSAAPEFPNVVRYQDQLVFSIGDPETDLIAFAGLPDDPTQNVFCGGDAAFAIVDFQDAGVRQGVIHSLAKGDEVNLDVYQRSTFVDPCVSTPIAEGTGRVMYLDNDALVTGDGANAWGFRIEGSVTLFGGGTAHLLAHNRFQILPDGTFRRVLRQVRLN
ncbi:MAG TPA: hypothetical protein VF105_06965 [Gemmatimonadaceae bacterium]